MSKHSPHGSPEPSPRRLALADAPAAPDAVEDWSDTAWAVFHDLNARHDHLFAPTAPAAILPHERGRPYANTQPCPYLPPPAAPVARRTVSLDDVLALARRNNRVCPQPARWVELYALLPRRQQRMPSPPMTGGAWKITTSLAKRMCLRDQIEWAALHGGLEALHRFISDLPEDQWLHMGD